MVNRSNYSACPKIIPIFLKLSLFEVSFTILQK